MGNDLEFNYYQARDGNEMPFRHYTAKSDMVVILLHGISEDSKYLKPLAEYISRENIANVITPDLRGYGEKPIRRGDLDYIGQHEDDLMDLITWIKLNFENPSIIMAGHSAGGGTTLRFAGSQYADEVQGYLLLAPFIHPNAPTTRKNNDKSNSVVSVPKLITILLLNTLKIRAFNHCHIYKNNKPKELQHGTETLSLSYRLLLSRFPNNYKKDLAALKKPTLVLIGDQDEEFDYKEYPQLMNTYTEATTSVVKDANHDGILSNEETFSQVNKFISSL